MTEQVTSGPKKGGRRAETPSERLERLRRDIQAAEQVVKDEQTRRCAAVGAAILAEAEGDPDFMQRVRQILKHRVTSKGGKELIAPVMAT